MAIARKEEDLKKYGKGGPMRKSYLNKLAGMDARHPGTYAEKGDFDESDIISVRTVSYEDSDSKTPVDPKKPAQKFAPGKEKKKGKDDKSKPVTKTEYHMENTKSPNDWSMHLVKAGVGRHGEAFRWSDGGIYRISAKSGIGKTGGDIVYGSDMQQF